MTTRIQPSRRARVHPGALLATGITLLALIPAARAATPPPTEPASDDFVSVVRSETQMVAIPTARGGPLPWTNVTIDTAGAVGSQLSVMTYPLANPASPWVAYYDASTNGGDLKFAAQDSTGVWATETVLSTANDEGNVTSIAFAELLFSGGGETHIIHYDQTSSTWEHAWGQPGSWQHETIESLGAPGVSGKDSGLGTTNVETSSVLYAAYPDVSASGIRFAAQVGTGGWTIAPHENGLNVRDIDLVVDSPDLGTAHLAYIDTDNFDLHYATRTFFGNFTSEIAQTDVGCGGCTVSLALDSQDRPHIIYPRFDGATSAIVHTWLDTGTWFAEDIETGTAADDFSYFSLEIDDFDNLHVAYRNGVAGQLRLARKIGGAWSTQDVASMGAGFGAQYVGLTLAGSCPNIVWGNPATDDLENEFPAGGSTHLVPADYASIQEATSFACSGDTVRVCDGTYAEGPFIEFYRKGLVVESENGPEATIMAGSFLLEGGASFVRPQSRIEGFTIRGQSRGVQVIQHDLVLEQCVITGTGVSPLEGSVRVDRSDAELIQCTIASNRLGLGAGGGLSVIGTNGSASVLLDRSIVWGNCALTDDTEISVENATLEVRDSLIDSTGVTTSAGTVTYTGGNVFTDPLFCAPQDCNDAPTTAGDYSLSSASPALPGIHPSGQLVGALEGSCGFFEDVTSGLLGTVGKGQGAAWGDHDGDGDPDLYITHSDIDNLLLLNLGGGLFINNTTGPLGAPGSARGSAWADYDNDGDLDLYHVKSGANQLFRNEGGVSFIDVSAGDIADGGVGVSAAWADYDNDGDLDVYGASFTMGSELFRNDGGDTFADVGTSPPNSSGSGTGVAWADYDGDGDMDFFLARSGTQADRLYRNDGGGTFVDVASGALANTGAGRGVAWGDYDNDGDFDLYLANTNAANALYRNDGGDTFVDVTSGPLAGSGTGGSVAWVDYDNDGDLDLYLGNNGQANQLFDNQGGGVFVEFAAGPLNDPSQTNGLAWADYDGDGDLDAYLANGDLNGVAQANKLIRNDATGSNHWIQLKLEGTVSNRDAVGAQVLLTAGGVTQLRQVEAGSGCWSQNDLVVAFGLGTTATIDAIEIRWPSGIIQAVTPPGVDQKIVVLEEDVTDVSPVATLPQAFQLHRAAPNPSATTTAIRYDLPRPATVVLRVYDVAGRLVRVLEDSPRSAGRHEAVWNGTNSAGVKAAPGVYFYRLEAGEFRSTQKLVRLR